MKDQLYTARYFVLKNMPEGAAKRALLATLRPVLGPEPVWYVAGGDDAPEVLPDIFADDTGEEKRELRIAWVVGHNHAAPGAWLKPPISESEFTFYNKAVDIVLDRGIAGVEMRKFNRVPNSRGYTAEIKQVYGEVNRFKPHLVFECHFNGGGGDYTVMLVAKGSKLGRLFGRIVQREAVSTFGFRDRGIWERTKGERGGASLFGAKAPMTLIEPFFGDNVNHARSISDRGAHEYVAEWLIESAQASLVDLYEHSPKK